MGLCSSSNVKYRTNNPAHEITCPEGALRCETRFKFIVKGGDGSERIKISRWYLFIFRKRFHDEKGEDVTIDFADWRCTVD